MIEPIAKKVQNSKRIGAVVGLVLLAVGFLSFSQTKPLTGTINAVIPPGLEVQMADGSLALGLVLGTSAVAATELSVGTNDWPLELYADVLPAEEGSALAFEYRLETAQESFPKSSWIRVLNSKLAPPIELPSPGWTTYTMSIRVSAQEGTPPGTFFRSLRLIFRSRSGLVEARDIPVSVTVFPSVSMDAVRVEGQSSSFPVDIFASEFQNAGSDTTLPLGESVVIITWAGITRASWEDLPAAVD